jgi:alpha-mannosidase
MKLRAAAALLATFLAANALGRQTESAIVVEVNDSAAPNPPVASLSKYLNGFHSSVDGQTIEYHSSDPGADSALLVRGQRVAHTASWQTDPLPEPSGDSYQFIWLAGIECAGFAEEKESHQFNLLINGQLWFTFKNAKDATARAWQIAGKDGGKLSFAATMTDHAGDLFGYMTLELPAKDFPPGQPLTLEVQGDNSGSADWYMTFQHRFNFVPQVRSEPALVRDGAHTLQQLRLSLDNLVAGRTVEVHIPDYEPIRAELKVGANVLRLPIPAVTSATTIPLVFKLNGNVVETSTVPVAPVHKRDFYLLSYSHNDIGYTDLQRDVERKQWNNLEQAMRLIHDTRDYPPDARYKWNMETIWALQSYLKQASAAQRNEFFADVRSGSIGLSALYANMLTGLANSVEMSHFFDFARALRADYHIPMTTAITSDVPGFSWGTVSAMAQSGVKYFATAPNSGDRIGYTLQAWGDKPFYWTSQSGEERVVTWMAGASYATFHEGPLSQLGDDKVMKLARRLDDISYPYEIFQLPYTLGDNGPPDPTLADFVRHWNDRYVTPRLILATHEQMFEEFEKRYGSTLPVMRGDFTPYWEDGAASSAFETALNRGTVDRLIQGEALWSMLSPASYPGDEYDSAWRNVIFYDEHTWGAHNSIEEPDLPFVKQQWEIKRKFALDADRASREMLSKALHSPAEQSKVRTAIDVYNTNSWPRTDVAFLKPELSTAGDRVVDVDGHPVPTQRLSTGELAVLIENVPPFSAKRLFVEKGQAFSRNTARIQSNDMENDFIAASVNSQTGAIDALTWKQGGVQLVDHAQRAGLNQYLYVLGTDPAKARSLSNVRVRVKERGNLVVSMLVEADAPGAKSYSTEIRLAEGVNRLDVITNIDKLPVRDKEAVHIAFPFSVPGGQLRYDVADAFVRPETDQLAGTCKNFFSVQSWVDISNRNYGVTWASPNAPLVEIGAITAEQPWMKSITPSSSIYSYVMNNYWHTNYKADQAGPVTFTYSILLHATFDAVEAAKFGTERRQPLIVSLADASTPARSSLLRLSSPNVLISSIKPIADGHSWLIYLYNPTEKIQRGDFLWNNGSPVSVRSSDASGAISTRAHDFEIAAFGSAYLRVDQAAPKSEALVTGR